MSRKMWARDQKIQKGLNCYLKIKCNYGDVAAKLQIKACEKGVKSEKSFSLIWLPWCEDK